MKHSCLLLFILSFSFLHVSGQKVHVSENTKRFIFFFHNKFIEVSGLDGVHPEYGIVEYKKITDTFRTNGFEVISVIRPLNPDINTYVNKTVKQIDSLLKFGILASQITVVGTSKGGYIAMLISGALKNKDVNYVFIGCCSEEDLTITPAINFCGRILSIYEKSDATVSCLKLRESSKYSVSAFKEVLLNTGLKHGYLYKALKEWMDPVMEWANGKTPAQAN